MPWGLRMMLMFALTGLLFQWYVARKAVNAITFVTGWPRKIVLISAGALVLWVMLYPLLMFLSYGAGQRRLFQAFQNPDPLLDAIFIYPFWVSMVAAIQMTLVFLLLDGSKLILNIVYARKKEGWTRVESWVVIALVCMGVVYAIARVYNDTFTVRTRETELAVANLPREIDGLRIVQIADLQADARTGEVKLRRYIDEVNSLKPDLILFGGDLVTSGLDYIDAGAEALARMESRYGIYACLGDHDHFSDKRLVKQSLERNGITVLDNVSTVIPVGAAHLSLTGLTNVYRMRPEPNTLETIERQRPKGPVNIMLTHQPSPELVQFAASKEYDLFVAGHTHGGQIVFPLPGFLLTGSSFETDYVTGFYRVGRMLVAINNGLGLTLAPIRYHAPAEVTLIKLRAM